MRPVSSKLSLLMTIGLAAAFIWASSVGLPPVVASHFTAGGAANGFMPRSGYVALMLGVAIGLPLLIAALSSLVRLLPPGAINLPNRDYWLAPERRAETIDMLARQGVVLGEILTVFLCFVHWLVVRANASRPPCLSESSMFFGFAVLAIALLLWIGSFVGSFARRPGRLP